MDVMSILIRHFLKMGGTLEEKKGWQVEICTDKAINFIEKNKDEPFFYMFHMPPRMNHGTVQKIFMKNTYKWELVNPMQCF